MSVAPRYQAETVDTGLGLSSRGLTSKSTFGTRPRFLAPDLPSDSNVIFAPGCTDERLSGAATSDARPSIRTVLHLSMPGLVTALAEVASTDEVVIAGGRNTVAASSAGLGAQRLHPGAKLDRLERITPLSAPRVRRHRAGDHLAAARSIEMLLATFNPVFEPVGADEAFVELHGVIGDAMAERIALKVKVTLSKRWAWTGSIGIGPNKLVAKMASSTRRDGTIVQMNAVTYRETLADIPVDRLWTVGRDTARRLHRRGVHTLSQLARSDRDELQREFGVVGIRLHDLAHGRDDTPVVGGAPATISPHSLGQEITLETVTHTGTRLEGLLLGYFYDDAQHARRQNSRTGKRASAATGHQLELVT
jgi:nucleotidyltransferase/DNA polymerase involved in DNA repair